MKNQYYDRYQVFLVFSILVFFYLGCNPGIREKSKYQLWFDEPAEYFEQSFVMGNGTMGATIYGGTQSELIHLNDATLWAGEPVDPYMNPEAYLHLPGIRSALGKKDYQAADSLNKALQGAFSESFAPLGNLHLAFMHDSLYENYRRELDITESISEVKYSIGDVNYSREYFLSHPDKVMAIKLKSNRSALNYDIKFSSLLRYDILAKEHGLDIHGYAPYHAEPSYRGDMPDAVLFDKDRGTRFTTSIRVVDTNGKITTADSVLSVREASESIILISVATSFNGYDHDPAVEGRDDKELALERMASASSKLYHQIKEDHIKDYRSFFDRVDIHLAKEEVEDLPTDDRLRKYAEGADDKGLEELYFQFGRYLLISSSRTEGVPANLQGIWNPYMRPPWSSNYTMNINVEENYWLAEVGNLSELHYPLLSFIENVAATGAVTAKTFYGVEKGWAACHNSDIWAMSNPVGDFGKGHPVWANWNMAGAWLSTHLWEHFAFTRDTAFLLTKGYPLMKGAAEFCLGWLTADNKGNLVSSPSTSPENIYLTPDGYAGATLYGSTSDHAMIRELFIKTIEASVLLDKDEEFRSQLENALKKLYPYQVGHKGNLQEWYHDWEDNDPKHRHQSHLFGLHPGNHISPELTPALAEACRRSLELKGDESTGWSKGWRINLWARLKDGNHAYKMYRTLLRYVDPTGTETNYMNRGGTYPNLLDAHPPFQIDGNFGGAAGVAEMLVQSTVDEIALLPALPESWPSGKIKGLCARGGFVIEMTWKDMILKECKIFSAKGGSTVVNFNNERRPVSLAPGETIELKW